MLHVYAVGGGGGSTMAMHIKGMLHEAKGIYNITPVTEERNVVELERQETPVGRSMMVCYQQVVIGPREPASVPCNLESCPWAASM